MLVAFSLVTEIVEVYRIIGARIQATLNLKIDNMDAAE